MTRRSQGRALPLPFALLSFLLAGSAAAAEADCAFERTLSRDVDASAVATLRLAAGAGALEVVGVEGASMIRVRGRACASSQRLLDEIDLREDRGDGWLAIATAIPEAGWAWFGSGYARLDLTVDVPARLALQVVDGSGPSRFSGIGPLELDDGSGEVHIEAAAGDLVIDDGSGALTLLAIRGDVFIVDGSGPIVIDGVEGRVTIEEDGSGEIDIRNVEGDVRIDEDGSGAILVREAGGDVRIGDDGSGDIDVRGVGGSLEVGREGSGSVRYERIQGAVDVPGARRERMK